MRKLLVTLAVVVPALASAATPPEGVPLQVRRGFFTEVDLGGFVAFGGNDGYSNLQSYLQLGLGYQLAVGEENAIPIGFHVGIGANAGNCYSGRNAKTGDCTQADNFTVTFLNLTVGYMRLIAERLYVGAKLHGGIGLLDPAPVLSADGSLVRIAPNFGLGASLEYATNMDHFTIGIDVVYRFIVGPNMSTLQFFPRVKYTF